MSLPKATSSICVMLALLCAVSAADEWEAFKHRMIPHIGKKVTVSGELLEGKDSPYVQIPNGGRVNLRFRFDDDLMEKNVTATGVLRYREYVDAPPGISDIPEMFYFEIGTVTFRIPMTR